ncbi:BTAD domain-containing putative transcriptional regulator [Amycolatopsis benzoatilytica]|uniref:BTAD domain-containing putative transcriptional regulator n=1 Tax=Amycolatopsis benzoatilytica TaxID=346045 RepID=UPI0003695D0A|nr:BTAD domain-containing putative transcriptional regulator [Amycolatopsis benzoatilytica]
MQIKILGPFEVRDGDVAEVPGARLRGLLVALALRPGRVVPKATLIDWIWGEHPPAEAANALQRLVSRLRKALPGAAVEGLTDGYRLAVDADAVDAVRFERLVAQARDGRGPGRLREALELWRGPAMQDVGLQGSEAFDAAATRLEALRLAAVEDRAEAEIDLGRGAELVAELTDLVAAHPVREKLVAALMRALAAAGRNTEALQAFQRIRETLAEELGADPSPELSALHVALLRGEVGRREENRKTNLRAEFTSYVGKEADVAAVRALVSEHRLTTLIGPGGSGKTRLASETARTLVADLRHGAWLVELAAIGTGDDVAQAALSGLGLRDALLGEASSADPADRLVSAIRDRETLLVLDNCEHVIEAAAALAHRLLGECRGLRILATSREPLGITGETLWPVEPLAEAEAVQLLRDRTTTRRQDLADDRTLARICTALDGMPLAIELAAVRLRTMSAEQLADRLDDRFRLLTGGSRTALPRHRTLRAMVDWSWELLSDGERMVLSRLSVFAGGASLEAAERVCAGDLVDEYEVLDLLAALSDKSLLVAFGEGAPRYRMLGTIKEYSAARLAEAGETDLARRAHRAYFTELAETAEPHLRRAEQLEWLTVLKAEHDNLVSAARGAVEAGDAHAAMRLAAGCGWYWWLVGRKAEGMELITAAIAVPGEVPDEIKAVVYALTSMFVTSGPGDVPEAAEWIHQAYEFGKHGRHYHAALRLVVPLEMMLRDMDGLLPAWESLLDDEDPWVRALSRLHIGKMRMMLGQDCEAWFDESLVEFRVLGERFGISFAQSELADCIAMRGEFAEANEHFDQAVAVVTELEALDDVAQMRMRQARLHWLAGDKDASAAAMAEAESLAEGVTWPGTLASLALVRAELARWNGDQQDAFAQFGRAMNLLGEEAQQPHLQAAAHDLHAWFAADLDEAREHRAAACRAAAETGRAPVIAQTVVGVADLALRRAQHDHAARLLAAGAHVLGRTDLSNPDVTRIEQEARRHLGDEAFDRATREGRTGEWTELVAAPLAP